MYKKDIMVEEIHNIRMKMWEESGYNTHSLVKNIQKEAKDFIEEYGYKYITTKNGYKRIVKSAVGLTAE